VPFLLSILLVGLGLWVRLKITETPDFARVLEEGPPPAVPLGELLRDHLGLAIGGTLGAVACFAVYYIATAFALGYTTTTMGIDRQVMLGIQLVSILFMAVGITLAGIWADKTSPARVLMWGCVGAVVAGLLLAPSLGSGSLWAIFASLSFSLLIMGFVYGPLGAWLPSLYPARVRYTGVSLAFNLAGIIGGGLTPVVAQALAQRGGLTLVGLYLAGASLLSLGALLALKVRSGVKPVAIDGV
jgi:hypothetical protein